MIIKSITDLNFKEDYKHVLHSQPNQWQAIGGYNNMYDFLFKTFTNDNMDKEKFDFVVDDTEYIFWIWRGDYLNLGAGAEIGIYSRPSEFSQDPEKLDQYFVDKDLSMPMELYLYNYENSKEIENIFSWQPETKQWWITGFNPNEYIPDPNRMVCIASVDFSGNEEFFDAIINPDNREMYGNDLFDEQLIFDESTSTVWFQWYI